MGKGTDKLYITHSEWSSSDAYSANIGAKTSSVAPFRRLPFNFCAASLQPFHNPVCTPNGTIFDVEVIGAWLENHPNQNPVDGEPLVASDLIRLNFAKNAADEEVTNRRFNGDPISGRSDLIDPVTYKVFTDNTHIVAIRHGNYANVFAWETVDRMNIRAKMWRDLVDDEPFSRADIITLQDPQNATSRNLEQFKYLRDGLEAQQTRAQEDAAAQASDINAGSLGRMGEKLLKAKAAVKKAREAREAGTDINRSAGALQIIGGAQTVGTQHKPVRNTKLSTNAATYTTGKAAASFTSTGLTPETSDERALLTEEEYMLKPRRVQAKGYARVETNLGDLTFELHPEFAPKAVWNFVKLAQKGYYRGVAFHRNIPKFMIQGGDPTGTGKGGVSIWGKYFDDELEGPLTHRARGTVSMANKGKNTNSSQFFITYKATPHLDRKHTVFGIVVDGFDVLAKMEASSVDESSKPTRDIVIDDIAVYLDPFELFQTKRKEAEQVEQDREEVRRQGGTEDDKTTWTGRRIRGDGSIGGFNASDSVGKYLSTTTAKIARQDENETGGDAAAFSSEPARKKARSTGSFGNFDNW